MIHDAFWGILIPFLGTSLGAGCVFFLKNALRDGIQRALTGFAAGVMVAASVWSLLIPAMEQAADLGRLAFFPAAGNGHTAVKLTLQELEAAAGAEGWVDVCKEPDGE